MAIELLGFGMMWWYMKTGTAWSSAGFATGVNAEAEGSAGWLGVELVEGSLVAEGFTG